MYGWVMSAMLELMKNLKDTQASNIAKRNTDTFPCITQGSVEAQDSVDEAWRKTFFVESGRKVGQCRGFGGEGRQEVPDRKASCGQTTSGSRATGRRTCKT